MKKTLTAIAIAAASAWGCETVSDYNTMIDQTKVKYKVTSNGAVQTAILYLKSVEDKDLLTIEDSDNNGTIDKGTVYRADGTSQMYACDAQKPTDICAEFKRSWDHYAKKAELTDLEIVRNINKSIVFPKPEAEPTPGVVKQ